MGYESGLDLGGFKINNNQLLRNFEGKWQE
jgi:hypothetical protein